MGDQRCYVLEAPPWYRYDACVRILWRDPCPSQSRWLRWWHVWLGFHPVCDLAGEAGGTANDCSPAIASSFNNMRLIVTVGWAIYPAGYFFGYLLGAVDDVYLNVVYNIADFVNKIAFVLSCWSCAKDDSSPKAEPLLA